MKKKIILAWSGGKDSSLALYRLLQDSRYEVTYLLTTLNAAYKRISMHGVREELLDKQAAAIGIPLLKVWIHEASYEEYERQMERVLLLAKSEGVEGVAFGDIFLEDLRAYREEKMAQVDMEALFPLWKEDTAELVRNFIRFGFRSVVCCVNDAYLDEEAVGKEIDDSFVDSLPNTVDPCGENGEFHSFCFAGPIFKNPIMIEVGEKLYRPLEKPIQSDECATDQEIRTKGFWYIDLVSA